MKKATKFTPQDIHHIAQLANIPVTMEEEKKLSDGFNTTLHIVDELFAVKVSGVEPTHHVTNLENVFREDKIDTKRTFTQEQALRNARKKHKGYFVVDQIIDQ